MLAVPALALSLLAVAFTMRGPVAASFALMAVIVLCTDMVRRRS